MIHLNNLILKKLILNNLILKIWNEMLKFKIAEIKRIILRK